MWIPKISLSKWFKIYPSLKSSFTLYCYCTKELTNIVPFVTKNYVGIKSDACSCGIGEKSLSIPRNEKIKMQLQNDIISFID
ncbi:Uncharacterised protein [Legionella pneumophila]|nr:Uncharacterised protein [Legionella pneumophila]